MDPKAILGKECAFCLTIIQQKSMFLMCLRWHVPSAHSPVLTEFYPSRQNVCRCQNCKKVVYLCKARRRFYVFLRHVFTKRAYFGFYKLRRIVHLLADEAHRFEMESLKSGVSHGGHEWPIRPTFSKSCYSAI